MSLFETLKKAIFYNPMAARSGKASAPTASAAPPTPARAPSTAAPAQPRPTAPAATTAPASPAAAQPAVVDVEGVLEALNAKSEQKLNWRTSIVDLMKLVDIDSSLQHRKELAQELGYTGDQNDSASMNIWLHKAVMRKLSESGGKVPSSLQ